MRRYRLNKKVLAMLGVFSVLFIGSSDAATFCGCHTYPGNPLNAYVCMNDNEDCTKLDDLCMVLPNINCSNPAFVFNPSQ